MVYSTGRKGGKTGFAAMMMLTAVLLFGGRFAEGYCVAKIWSRHRAASIRR